ncbi:MAG: DUF721 domain-containing protein [Oceanipulchritudo sp.]
MPGKFSRRQERLIASFRGLQADPVPARDSWAKSMGSLIETLVERHHIGKKTPEESIQENWTRIVGEAFARRCRPERIDRSGALIVQVPNATVRRELIFSEGRMLTAIGSLPDCHHINRIILKAGQ